MKTILTINGRHYILPMPKAIAVMQAMQSAIRVDEDYRDLAKPGQNRRYGYQYTVHEIQDRCSVKQIDDADIVIPPGVQTSPDEPKPKKARKALPAPPVRQLGFGGAA